MFNYKLDKISSHSAIQRVRWSALGTYSTQGIKCVVYVVLARLLEPQDFGLLGMAMIFVSITEVLSHLGSNTIVIQQKQISQDLLSSLFYLNLAMGIILGGLLVMLSPLFGWLVKNTQITPILQVLAIGFVISSIGSVHRGLLRRHFLFNRLAIIQISTAIIKGTVAISLAIMGYKVWALVIAIVVSATMRILFLFIATTWLPSLCLNWTEIKRVKSSIFNLTGFGIFNTFSRKADTFIIGRYLGASSLGYYSLAYALYTLPNQYISHVVANVLLPSLSAAQENNRIFREKYLRACSGIAAITFPLTVGLFVLAKPFVLTVYGEKWHAAVPIVAILAFVGFIQSIAVTVGNIFIAKNRTGIWLLWGIGSGLFIVVSFICGLPWGVVGVTSAYAIAMVPLSYFSFLISFRFINLRMMDFVKKLAPYAIVAGVMGIIIFLGRLALEMLNVTNDNILIVCTTLGATFYLISMQFLSPPAFIDIKNTLLSKSGMH